MWRTVMKDPVDCPPLEDYEAKLERALEDEFLRQQGRTREEVARLPDAERAVILSAASTYASGRLAEIGTRAHYVNELHREH
jgi:hypothetical protein